jgi:hypothetical protein
VPTPQPSALAVLRIPAPVANCARIRSTTSALSGRRPRRFPCAQARARPRLMPLRTERSSASVGSGIFRCRSGCRPGGVAHSRWVPIQGRLRRSLSRRYFQRSAERMGGYRRSGSISTWINWRIRRVRAVDRRRQDACSTRSNRRLRFDGPPFSASAIGDPASLMRSSS